MASQRIEFTYLSQEDFINAGCFDMKLAMQALEEGLIKFKDGHILFPDKIVQIFNEETQERINCLPATLLDEKVCGMKWVSVFPPNPVKYGTQNLTALIVLSEIVKGYPVCVMEATLCSNMRVAAMGATAAKYLSRENSESIGFIGAGEQAKMHLLGMMAVRPGIKVCRIAAKYEAEEQDFIRSMQPIFPDLKIIACNGKLEDAIRDSDIIVTATSAQAPLLKAAWIRKGAFYSHIGGWEDEYAVVKMANKIVCDDWNIVKHRTQTVSRCFKDGVIGDSDIYCNIVDLVSGAKKGRENDDEFIYFDAVGLSYIDVSIANAMYERAKAAGAGTVLPMQENKIFDKELSGKIKF